MNDTLPDDEQRTGSIVDEIFDLDELLAGDVRRAEMTVYICTKPHLEADIQELEQRLSHLVDATGAEVGTIDAAVGEASEATEIAATIQAKRAEMAAAMRPFRFRQLSDDAWKAFYEKHKADITGGKMTDTMFGELVVASALTPAISAPQLAQIRAKFGHPAADLLSAAAWKVNTESGVSVPKSSISSRVLKQGKRE